MGQAYRCRVGLQDLTLSASWRSVVVSGDDEFRRTAFIEGRARGLDVEGYKATERDEQTIQDRAQAMQAEKAPPSADTQRADRAQAVRDLQADELVGTYPDMTKEAGVVQAAQVFANEKIEQGEDRVQFMSQIRDQVAERVENGQDLGQINVREERPTERDTEREAEQAPER